MALLSSSPNLGSHTLPRINREGPSEEQRPPRPASIHSGVQFNTTNNQTRVALFPPQRDIKGASDTDWRHLYAPLARAPSQAQAMSTTVPQSLVPKRIAGRHVPTKNSLRHSRMVVMSRNGKVPKKYLPPVMRYHRLGICLATLQTLLGFAVTSLSVWLVLWAPNLRIRDIPHWSGVPLLLSGLFGLMLLCCCRKEYPGMKHGTCVFSVKIISVSLASIATVAAFCASAFAAVHLAFLSRMTCEDTDVYKCSCHSEADDRTYLYEDLSCLEVENILQLILIGSCAANALAGFISAWYVFLHWISRYMYVYSTVTGQDDSAVVVTGVTSK